jgi:TPR repeat protein
MKKIWIFAVWCLLTVIAHTSLAQRGCCSWHGGVSGCDGNSGRQICRDGTYSPSCICPLVNNQLNAPKNSIDNPIKQPKKENTQALTNQSNNQYAQNTFPNNPFCQSIQACQKLAIEGSVEAKVFLASIYEYGRGSEINYPLSIYWYKSALDSPVIPESLKPLINPMKFQLELMYRDIKDYSNSIVWGKAVANTGFVPAMEVLGEIYYYNLKNYPEAFTWYEKAAKLAEPVAQAMLGQLYARGEGVLEDDVAAYAWTAVAIANGLSNEMEEISLTRKNALTSLLATQGIGKVGEENPLIQAKSLAQDFYEQYMRKPEP